MNKKATVEIVKQISGALTALIPFVGIVGLNLEWFNESFIQQFEVAAIGAVSFVYTCYRIYKNHYAKKAMKSNKGVK